MGEIKSTLDLVMARTRHLTLSEEEKQQQQREEARKRLAGLVQQYEDGRLSPERLLEAVDGLGADYGIQGRRELALALPRRTDPDQGPDLWSPVVASLSEIDPAGWRRSFEQYREDRDQLSRRHVDAALERLAAEGISGSAVVPNLPADPDWQAALEALREAFHRRLEAALPGAGEA
ncbi:MAG: hypothetical protein JRF23_02455 [Deltaproteobacteria bacterium]|nr:hypothetical protein [Deltaproteobacteria bacterium]